MAGVSAAGCDGGGVEPACVGSVGSDEGSSPKSNTASSTCSDSGLPSSPPMDTLESRLRQRVESADLDLSVRLSKLRTHAAEYTAVRDGAGSASAFPERSRLRPQRTNKTSDYVWAVKDRIFEEVANFTTTASLLKVLLRERFNALPAEGCRDAELEQKRKICRLLQLLRNTTATSIKQARWALRLQEEDAASFVRCLRADYDFIMARPRLRQFLEDTSHWLQERTLFTALCLTAFCAGAAFAAFCILGIPPMAAVWGGGTAFAAGGLGAMAVWDCGQEVALRLHSNYCNKFEEMRERLQAGKVTLDALLQDLELAHQHSLRYDEFLLAHESYGMCVICREGFFVNQDVVFSATPQCGRHHKFHRSCLNAWGQSQPNRGTSQCPCCRRAISNFNEVHIDSPFV
eukprot:jgi/Chlat1/5939/Chrsp4S06415